MHTNQAFFQDQPIRFIDQSNETSIFQVPNQAMTSFAIDDAIATAVGNHEVAPTVRIWVHDKTIVLGIPDSRLPYLEQGLEYIKTEQYKAVIRNSGGLAVALDKGVVNISFILPNKGKISIHDGYDLMFHFIQQLFRQYTEEIKAYEIVGSYCPGDYDLSIDGIKFAGISQRRVRNGVAIQIYLDVEGDSKERAAIVQQFYQLSKSTKETTYIYPDVNPHVMGTISELIGTPFTVEQVIQQVKETLHRCGAHLHTEGFTLSEKTTFYKRLEQMKKRNQKISAYV